MVVARLLEDLVEMCCIFFEKVVGGKVCTAAKPLIYNFPVFVGHFEIAEISMGRRDHRVHRMNDQADSRGVKILRTLRDGAFQNLWDWPVNFAHVDARFLKSRAL